MNLFRALLPFLAYAVLLGCSTAAPSDHARTTAPARSAVSAEEPDLGRFFKGVEGTFVFLDTQTGRTVHHNPERARTRFLPASTYKIPNTLIALEIGVASGPDFPLAWDSTVAPRQLWWPAVWTQDHTLRTALPNSVVWYFQEFARRIGSARMQVYVDQFEYGTGHLGRDRSVLAHWGAADLPRGTGRLPTALLLRRVGSVRAHNADHQRPPGAGGNSDVPAQRQDGLGRAGRAFRAADWMADRVFGARRKVYFFATNIDIETVEDAATRLSITKAILRDLGLLSD